EAVRRGGALGELGAEDGAFDGRVRSATRGARAVGTRGGTRMSERSKVVVVDDNPGNRYAVARVLRAEGYEVIEGASAADALRLTRSEQPEVLVLDIKLPDMLGFEVNRILREDPITRHVSILNMSASYTGPESQALGLG